MSGSPIPNLTVFLTDSAILKPNILFILLLALETKPILLVDAILSIIV